MTGVLLRIDEAIRAPEDADLEEAREDVRRSLDDVRRIARDLRPDTLEELGLRSALSGLAAGFSARPASPSSGASTTPSRRSATTPRSSSTASPRRR